MKRAVCLALALGALAATPAHAGDATPSPAEREFAGLLNHERASRGLGPVEISPALTEVADDYAAFYLASGVEIDHDYDPPYTQRTQAAGCDGWLGPVLARNVSPRAVLDAWLGSNGHRAVLLDPTITHIGPGNAGEYWLAYGLTCKRNGLNSSGDFGEGFDPRAIPPVGDLVIGKTRVRGASIGVKVKLTTGATTVRLFAKRGRRVVRSRRERVARDAPAYPTLWVRYTGRWKVWLESGGHKYPIGRVRIR